MTKNAERVGSAIAVVVGVFYLINCFSISDYTPNPMDVGSRAYPLAVGILVVALSLIWTFKAWRPVKETHSTASPEPQQAGGDFSWIRLLALAALTFLAVALIEPIGFLPVGFVYLLVAIITMVWEKPSLKQVLIYAVVAALGAFALKWLLIDLLGIYLP